MKKSDADVRELRSQWKASWERRGSALNMMIGGTVLFLLAGLSVGGLALASAPFVATIVPFVGMAAGWAITCIGAVNADREEQTMNNLKAAIEGDVTEPRKTNPLEMMKEYPERETPEHVKRILEKRRNPSSEVLSGRGR